ncbi:MAG: hypothetical protein AAGF12_34090 [Myxococcota bacterium]
MATRRRGRRATREPASARKTTVAKNEFLPDSANELKALLASDRSVERYALVIPGFGDGPNGHVVLVEAGHRESVSGLNLEQGYDQSGLVGRPKPRPECESLLWEPSEGVKFFVDDGRDALAYRAPTAWAKTLPYLVILIIIISMHRNQSIQCKK